MLGGFFSVIILVFAVGVAFFAVFSPEESVINVVDTLRFIDIMLPILAVGALIKYLFTFQKKTKNNSESELS